MSVARERVDRFWQSDVGLSVLLGSLAIIIFITPALSVEGIAGPLVVQVFFTIVLLFGLTGVTHHRSLRAAGTTVFAIAIVLFWSDFLAPGVGLRPARAVGGLLATSLLTGLVFHQVVRQGPITRHRIMGAVAVYLLLGLSWATVYELIEGLSPGAFRFADPVQTRNELVMALAYYSFVTLTTMGYGDITPFHPLARSAAILEALVGQLFPAILIARLVSMELASHRQEER